ncbi:MAG: exodeoxyribonuclease VII large subunit [Firmicutes bacterium]|nr:exodeoxyribonuclease VII large subunit [Bacillota bacterium]
MHQMHIITVSQLTRQIKTVLEQPLFQQLKVEGEISNFKHHSSGHMYFTLKDEHSRIRAVMFRGRNIRLGFEPKNGDTVVAIGSLGVYEPNGEYQIYVEQMLPQGVGLLHIRFEELKQKLEQEGLFDPERKRPLPFLPRKVAVITSPTSAAVRDVISVIKRRFPAMELLIVPAVVQGEDGPQSVTAAFEQVNSQNDVDLVIVTRGGGSIEELWTFNDETVARAIYNCSVPVISGIGHETDFTIADFAADHRAATPSAAAELAVPDYYHLSLSVNRLSSRLLSTVNKLINEKRTILGYLTKRSVLLRPKVRINQERQRVDESLSRICLVVNHQLNLLNQRLLTATGKLDSLSPLSTLSRGYAVCQKPDKTVVTDPNQVKIGEDVVVRVKSGRLWCQVKKGEQIKYERRS